MGQGGSRYKAVIKAIESNNPKLTEIKFDRGEISEKAAGKIGVALKANNVLLQVDLKGCDLNPATLHPLADALNNIGTCSNIRKLDLSNNALLGPDGGKYLASVILNNKVLQHLCLNNCGLLDEGTFPIADGEFGMEIRTRSTLEYYILLYFDEDF
jgi:Ran GTPase-activating protein (RanGAP) involved in mRNA processing and transport